MNELKMSRNSKVRANKMKRETQLRTRDVRNIATQWIKIQIKERINGDVSLGLPEWDDRSLLWRVALVPRNYPTLTLGEIHVDTFGKIAFATDTSLIEERLAGVKQKSHAKARRTSSKIYFPPIPNKAILGDCRHVLAEFPPESIQLVFTSPPYFNAKPEYAQYRDYPAYLSFLDEVFSACHAVLAEGRFLIVNVSPVLIRRPSRNSSSKRLPIPFDLHPILSRIGFEFIDEIIWRKPEGAGWNLGRGRRFAADRQPLQYKPVTTTENILVYRKSTDRLIDWNLRYHPDSGAVERSRILGEYEKTDVWDITPAHHKEHPAVFPKELVYRILRYYSFEGDCVLDPFAGVGTVGRAAIELDRRFVLIENSPRYYRSMWHELGQTSLLSPKQISIDFDDLQYGWAADDNS